MIDREPIVYIVNADPQVRAALRKILTDEGLHAIAFDSAAAYREYPRSTAPACLMLDVELPDVSGLDLQHEIASSCPPIVFVTRRADVACSVRAIKQGAVDYLPIPFRHSQLIGAVLEAIQRDCVTRADRTRVNELRQRYARLTDRERQVLTMVASGMMNKVVASELGLCEITVQVHRRRVMQKMEARSFAELVRQAETLRIPLDTARKPTPRVIDGLSTCNTPENSALADVEAGHRRQNAHSIRMPIVRGVTRVMVTPPSEVVSR